MDNHDAKSTATIPANMAKDIAELLISGVGADFTIIAADDKELRVHRLVLIARSEAFSAMLTRTTAEKWNEKRYARVDLHGGTLEVLLQYLDSGSVVD
ncbi:hypothetical protein BV898_02602 [Hypsibius exemplaris]|uniref:BTB domain-containing protein n=1 Tax=Hypsibius exemplaris TaxID=2072580 RepID=A0A1W0X834_HYPEX|nr:hypothetical protein BV898_02602 [Hypsibius exemplaris]